MRRICAALRAVVIVCLVLLCGGLFLCLRLSPRFERGEGYELYSGTSSALIVQTGTPFLDKIRLKGAAGESVRYEGDRYEELKEQFRATLLFTEEAGGAVNYYLYSPLLGAGVEVNGVPVNLHIAVRAGRTAAGSPIIFGGI